MVEIQLLTLHHILVSVQTYQALRSYNKTMFRVSGAMAMICVVRKVARVVCSAIGEAPKVATGDHVLQRVVQVREASLFEPGFHWSNMIQAHHMSCSENLENPHHWEVRMQSCSTHSSYNLVLGLSSHCWIFFVLHALLKFFQVCLLLLIWC